MGCWATYHGSGLESAGESESRAETKGVAAAKHGEEKNGLVFAATRMQQCKADDVWTERRSRRLQAGQCKVRCAEEWVSGNLATNSAGVVNKDWAALEGNSCGN